MFFFSFFCCFQNNKIAINERIFYDEDDDVKDL